MATTSHDAWTGFRGTGWRETIDVGGFIHDNIEPYTGGPEFLTGPTHRTERIWRQLERMFVEERRRGVYDVDAHIPSTITSHEPGYRRVALYGVDRLVAERRSVKASLDGR